MRIRASLVIGLAVAAGLTLAACESTQSKSARLEKEGKTVLLNQKGLSIGKASSAVKVGATTVLSSNDRTGVVVELHNNSQSTLINVPILIDVKGKNGKSVFKNNTPGLDPSLTSAPVIGPGQTFDWVNDQVLATAPAKSVDVQVGEAKDELPGGGGLPELEVSKPELSVDPVSGVVASGKVTNKSNLDQTRLVIYGVAKKGSKIVAAGRSVIQILKAGGKPGNFHIYFVGDPRGADLNVTAPPTVVK
jgi:hypothetical protein